mgnify:CR=1 FL=1
MGKREEAVRKVREYLDRMGLNYVYDEEHGAVVVPFRIKGREFLVFVLFSENWVTTVARITGVGELPRGLDRERLFARLLMESFYLNEICLLYTSPSPRDRG